MSFYKNGNIKYSDFSDSLGNNILNNGHKYNFGNPYVVSGTSSDIYVETNIIGQVTPSKTYYLLAKCTGWADGHGYTSSRSGKGTIWIYASNTYNSDGSFSWNDTSANCFSSSNWISEGVWKYTMSSSNKMAKIRLNTYSDGSTTVTCKFWDIYLIPSEYYASNVRMFSDYMISQDFLEI